MGYTPDVVNKIDYTNPVFILDIAKYQNRDFDYDALRKGGVILVIIKATQDKYWVDPLVKQHFDNFKKHGFEVGFYHFINPNFKAIDQVEHFQDTIKEVDPDGYHIFEVLDLEYCPGVYGGNYAGVGAEFMLELEKVTDKRIGIYFGTGWTDTYAKAIVDKYLLTNPKDWVIWMASYPTYLPIYGYANSISWDKLKQNIPNPTNMYFPGTWTNKNWDIWQFSGGNMLIDGYPGVIDLNIFNGSKEEFYTLMGVSDPDAIPEEPVVVPDEPVIVPEQPDEQDNEIVLPNTDDITGDQLSKILVAVLDFIRKVLNILKGA